MSPAALQRPLDPAYIGSPFQQTFRLFAGSLDAPMNLTGRTLSMHLQLQGRTAGEPILITGAGQADGVATFTADTDDWDKGDYSIEVRLDGEAILVGRLPVAQGASEGGVDTLGAAQPPMAVNLVVAPAGQVQLVMASTAFPSVANIGLPSDLGALFGGATTLSEALAWLAEYGGGGSSPVVVGLAGGIVSQSLISGSLSVDEADAILLSGVISGTGAAAGAMSVTVVRALSGALMASSSLTGSLTVSEANVISLVGAVDAQTIMSGSLGNTPQISLSGTVAALAALTGDLSVQTGAEPALYLGNVATRARIPTNRSTTNRQFNSRSYHVARDTITSLQIELPNWYWNRKGTGTETAGGGNATYSAAIEYPEGVFTQVLFSGATTRTVASGNSALSDAVTINIPNGAGFWVRTFCNAATAIVFIDGETSPVSPQSNFDNGEAMEYGVSGLTDKTMGGTITPTVTTTASAIFCPTAVVAMTRRPTILMIGDSRVWGYADTFDVQGNQGELARSLGGSFGYINAGSAGDTLSAYIAGNARRTALKQYVSHVIVQTAINALRSGGSGQNKTAAAVLAEQQTILGYFSDKICLTSTTAPQATSTDSWATEANQTVNANTANINTYNDAIRAGVAGSVGYFDISDAVSSARNSGKWKADGTASKYTADGLHSTPFGYATIAASGAVEPALITRA